MTGHWRLFWEGFNTACAQCYPRLACPLHVSLLMQLHDPARSAPALAPRGEKTHRIIMQIHAHYACIIRRTINLFYLSSFLEFLNKPLTTKPTRPMILMVLVPIRAMITSFSGFPSLFATYIKTIKATKAHQYCIK